MINRLDTVYYISQGKTIQDHLLNIKKVCAVGVRLVQLRLKDTAAQDIVTAAEAAKALCDYYGAHLIINDNSTIAKGVCPCGVHLGLEDGSIAEARKMFGPDTIIGGTANTYDDCLNHIEAGADYIGLGPYRFTNTKKRLSPILGIDGYHRIVKKIRNAGHTTPIYAIGGIRRDDLIELRKAGVYGVALSGLLSGISENQLQVNINGLRKYFRKPEHS